MVTAPGFWSGETLKDRLTTLITPFDPDRVDCSAYTLSMGRELYVSPNDATEDPQSVTIRKLSDGEAFTIPPGQFAFLLTEEKVEIPDTALALISIKAKIKWRGLINVSGFHVDPGFRGRLIFSVYNAGPVPVHLRQGQPMFLIWYSSLDKPTKLGRSQPVQETFPADLISGISGELQSLAGMNKKIKDLDKSLTERVHSLEREQSYLSFAGARDPLTSERDCSDLDKRRRSPSPCRHIRGRERSPNLIQTVRRSPAHTCRGRSTKGFRGI